MGKTGEILSIEEIRVGLAPIFEEKGLKLVLVFGSVVSGKVHKRSDIDLAFLFDDRPDMLELTNRVIRLLKTDRVDVVDLGRANPLLKFLAARGGRVLYERSPGLFSEFYSLAFRRYVDTKKLRDAQRTAITDFLESRGLA
ncbi:MAG: nucleotidyltransferase domain-containing protein [Thermodesulfobacteriota bacterium]